MFKRMRRWFRAVGHGGRLDDQMDQELAFHLELEAAKLERQGLTPEAARTEARRAFGGVERVREEVRDTRRTSWVDTILRNVRYARRSLARNPGYTRRRDRHAWPRHRRQHDDVQRHRRRAAEAVALRGKRSAGAAPAVVVARRTGRRAAVDPGAVRISRAAGVRLRRPRRVPPDVLRPDQARRSQPRRRRRRVGEFLRRAARASRFSAGRSRPPTRRTALPAVLLLSNAYWKTRFGGDPTIVGQVFQMNDRPHTVVGVLPPVPIYPQESDVYMPTSACPFRARGEEHIAETWKSFSNLRVFGRLKPGVTIEAASAHVATVAQRSSRATTPRRIATRAGSGAAALGLLGELTRNARPMLLILLGSHRAGAAARLRERREPDAGAHAESRSRACPSHGARRRTPAARRSAADRKRDAGPRRRHRGAAARRHDAGRARHLHRPLYRARRGHRHRRPGAGVHRGRLDPDRPGIRRAAGARHAPGAGARCCGNPARRQRAPRQSRLLRGLVVAQVAVSVVLLAARGCS